MLEDDDDNGELDFKNKKNWNTFQWIRALAPIVNILVVVGGIWAYFADQSSNTAVFSQKFTDFQYTINTQLASIESQISQLPAQGEIVNQMQAHLHAIDERLDALDARLRDVEQDYAGVRADLDNIIQSDNVNLGPRRPHR